MKYKAYPIITAELELLLAYIEKQMPDQIELLAKLLYDVIDEANEHGSSLLICLKQEEKKDENQSQGGA